MRLNTDLLSVSQTEAISHYKNQAHDLLETIFSECQVFNEPHIINLFVFSSKDPFQNPLIKKLMIFLYIKDHKKDLIEVLSSDSNFLTLIKDEFLIKTTQTKKAFSFKFLKSVIHFFLQYLLGVRMRKKGTKEKTLKTLVELNIVESMISGHDINDRYYTGYGNYLQEEAQKDIVYLPQFLFSPQNFLSFSKKLQKADLSSFLIKESFLNFSDYLKVLFQVILFQPKGRFSSDNNLNTFLKAEFIASKYTYTNFLSLLNYRFCSQLKKKDIKIDLFIDWFENQSTDKSLHLGFSCFLPHVYRKGYQSFLLDYEYQKNIIPTKREYHSKTLPHEVLVSGELFMTLLQDSCPNIEKSIAPSYRFEHLFHESKSSGDKISVFLSSQLDQNLESYKKIKAVVKSHPQFLFEIKNHPAAPINIENNPQFKEFHGDAKSLLSESRLVITTSLSIAFEAHILGIPIILLGTSNYILQTLPFFNQKKDIKICWDHTQLENAMTQMMTMDISKENIDFLISDYLTKPDKELTTVMFSRRRNG